MKNNAPILFLVLLQLSHAACTAPAAAGNPPGYDITRPVVYRMPPVLAELSGVAFNAGNADTVFAEQDEEGKLFYFHPGDTQVKNTRFAKRGDYEDLAITNGTVIMLRSDGMLLSFGINAIGNKETIGAKEQPDLLPAGEYESMYADDAKNLLYVLCKNCGEGKSGQSVPGYIFSVDATGSLHPQGNFSVDEKIIARLAGKEKIRYKASGIAQHPITHEWYILSSVNKMLVIADAAWKPLGAYPLNPALFTQPEGIAFDRAGNLYIANEKGNAANGSLLQFSYMQEKIKK